MTEVDPRRLTLMALEPSCGPDCARWVSKWIRWSNRFDADTLPAMIDLGGMEGVPDYRRSLTASSRNMIRKASRSYDYEQFSRNHALEQIYRVNTSMPIRSGGPMRPAYMEMPKASAEPTLCDRHASIWLGAFDFGNFLKGYAHIAICHDLAIINTILGHVEALSRGVMNGLIDAIVKTALDYDEVRYVNYLSLSGPPGLDGFKRRVGFQPVAGVLGL